ncbi:MAG: hypothetical protein Q8P80_05125 [Candidatus Levybacteria bacterium]|nr:hypothetical protein [Candidatus Levybacteria bacterium]
MGGKKELVDIQGAEISRQQIARLYYQLHLGEKLPRKVFYYDPEVIVYPEGCGRRVIKDMVFATRNGKRIKGYTGFTALNSARTYFEGWHEPLYQGDKFGAPTKLAHQITLKAS